MRRFFVLFALLLVSAPGLRAQSPYESSADFAKYAMKLREQALLKVEPQVFVPTTSRTSMTRFPWKTNIITTVFWAGEQPTGITRADTKSPVTTGGNFALLPSDPSARPNYIPLHICSQQKPFTSPSL